MDMYTQGLWEQFLALLAGLGTAVEVRPGRVRLTPSDPDGADRDVEILISPEQWEEMVSVGWGGICPEPKERVTKIVLGRAPEERFLVYGDYTLTPSAAEELPVDEDLAPLQEQAREHPEGFGRWVVRDDGNVIDEFAWHPE